MTLFVDLEERKTLHISAGKDHKTVVDFVEVLEVKQGDRNAIKQVSCDMSPAFIKGVKENMPEAEITFAKAPFPGFSARELPPYTQRKSLYFF
ncbi:hypothetical protein BMR02_07290 [Methylococcaceae bacterium HT1]|nr:hypothetical protein BMR02_07290 [Methylococcaceae bacterium HT1]